MRDELDAKKLVAQARAGAELEDFGEDSWQEGLERLDSRGRALFADKLLSAMRFEFGGHREQSKGA